MELVFDLIGLLLDSLEVSQIHQQDMAIGLASGSLAVFHHIFIETLDIEDCLAIGRVATQFAYSALYLGSTFRPWSFWTLKSTQP